MRGLGIGHRLVKLLLQQVQARAVPDIALADLNARRKKLEDKVLCCVGSPYPEVYLSAQRYRYFVWDLVSVQAAFWATDPGGLQRLLARSRSASSASGAVAASGDPHTSSRTRSGTKPAGNGSCSATAARAPARSKERESLAAAAPATGDMLCCGCADASCHDNLSNGTPGWNKSGSGHSTNVTAVAASGLCTADPVAWHLHVVSMSAVVSPRERLHRFPLGQVAWAKHSQDEKPAKPQPPGAPQHDQQQW
eukprot:XP_001698438.1 predicted protein [Chlamydomonas reinhardtii]